jgi:DNA-binding NarL/FixJ family response regulator
MNPASKQRPSKAPAPGSSVRFANHSPPRVFRNSYTRGGQRFLLDGWSVKIQHRGVRRTLSLQAPTKAAALLEAKALKLKILTKGWETVLRGRSGRQSPAGGPAGVGSNFGEHLLTRRYLFPASPHSAKDLAVRLEHEGTGYWFPLGTAEHASALARAEDIYQSVLEQGWEFACNRFSRELMVGFEWCAQPLLWTYTTIHTLPEDTPGQSPANNGATPHVLLVEEDAGIGRAMAWCINQHTGTCAVSCDSTDSVDELLARHRPHLVLLNRNLAGRMRFESPGQIAPLRPGVPALSYSVAADGDKLFVSTPGGASGYLLRRLEPTKILEPVLPWGGAAKASAAEMMSRVKNSFKDLLMPRDSSDDSGLARLTRREHEVLVLLSKGFVDKEIAQALGISTWTVHGHVKNIFERLNVRTRTEAAVRFLEK